MRLKTIVHFICKTLVSFSCNRSHNIPLSKIIEQGYTSRHRILASVVESLSSFNDTIVHILIIDSLDTIAKRVNLKFSEFEMGDSSRKDFTFDLCMNSDSISYYVSKKTFLR